MYSIGEASYFQAKFYRYGSLAKVTQKGTEYLGLDAGNAL
jgi:hypothetical protein